MVRGAFSSGDRGSATGNGRHVVAQSNQSESTHNLFKAQHQVFDEHKSPSGYSGHGELRRQHGWTGW